MVQGGGFDVDLKQKDSGRTVVNESKIVFIMIGARLQWRAPATPTLRQPVFINQRNNPRLDWTPFKPGYTVFGEVISGMRIVDFMASTPTGNAMGSTDKERCRRKTYRWTQSYFFASRAYPNDNS